MCAVRVGIRVALTRSLLPALCVSCGDVLDGDERGLCGACRSRLLPLTGRSCPRCGALSDDDEEPCLVCHSSPPPQQGTVIWGVYEGVLRDAVLAMKNRGHDELARPLAHRLAARISLEPWSTAVSAVCSVPSHRLRGLRRGPSVADLLARELAAVVDRPRIVALRRHGLGRQTGRTRAQRSRLPRGVFSACRTASGQRLLVVDDVHTTGTTLRRASETLLEGGAETVFCAAIAGTPDPRRI